MWNRRLFVIAAAILAAGSVMAQDAPADIVNDEGGAVTIGGELAYTYEFLSTGVTQPVILLDDLTGYTDPDRTELFVRSPLSQIFGTITSDFTQSPFTYSLSLPIEPLANFNDVDGDSETDQGLQIFNVIWRLNVSGDTHLDERDYTYTFGSWLTYASTRLSEAFDSKYGITGGKLLIYAPDDQQSFPSGLGEDGILFTDDDAPAVIVPQGWTVVDLDTDPFTFDRSREPSIDLYEPPLFESSDYSDLSYTEAFDALTAAMREDYAFTELKDVDWDALIAEFRPRFEEAEANQDSVAYQLALRDFNWSIPDGHVYIDTPALNDLFFEETDGGLGMSIRELDDGRVLVTYVLEDGPADEAGISERAEILELNGEPIGDAISANIPWSSPFSNDEDRRYQQLRYVLRFPVDTEVEVVYQNPDDDDATAITLTTIPERDSMSQSSINNGIEGDELPVEFRILDNGYGYVQIHGFFEDFLLTTKMWEWVMQYMNTNGIPGLIVDMRQNGGGESNLADGLASYFFDHSLVTGNSRFYTPGEGFTLNERDATSLIEVPEQFQYLGPVAVLVGPGCGSACELFAFDLTLEDRAAIVGHYPSAGLGGYINAVTLPEGLYMQYTRGQGVGPDGEINIEGTGVAPTIDVPVTEETLFEQDDAVLDAAVAYLDSASGPNIVYAGEIAVGDEVTGDLNEGERVQFTLTLEEDTILDIRLGDEDGELDTVLRVLDLDGNSLAENDDAEPGVNFNSALLGLELEAGTYIIEAGTYDDANSGTATLSVQAAE